MLLIGPWKNVEDVEESLCIEEVDAILLAHHENLDSDRRFLAALKGIDLGENQQDTASKFDEVKARAEARILNVSVEELKGRHEIAEYDDFGLDYEIEE